MFIDSGIEVFPPVRRATIVYDARVLDREFAAQTVRWLYHVSVLLD